MYTVPSEQFPIPPPHTHTHTHTHSQSNGTEERSSPVSPSLPPDWTEHKTSSGHLYYYNTSTGQSSWTRPSETADSTAENTKSQLEVCTHCHYLTSIISNVYKFTVSVYY